MVRECPVCVPPRSDDSPAGITIPTFFLISEQRLTDEERDAVAHALRQHIAADPFPLAPRLRPLKAALAKLEPPVTPRPEPFPAPKPSERPSLLYRKLTGTGRRR